MNDTYVHSHWLHCFMSHGVNVPFYIIIRFVGLYLATKVFVGKLLATRGVWVIIGLANDERGSTKFNS